MNDILSAIALYVERGKINAASPYPPDLKGQDGVDELTKKALEDGISPSGILSEGLIVGMKNIGEKFRLNKVFIPEVLMAAKAMSAAMEYIRPFFVTGEVKRKGTFVIGTVAGDLHEIGKNIVAMIVEGAGWEVVDLGVDVSKEQFLDAIETHPHCVVGLSALLTTTMKNMAKTVSEIKVKYPHIHLIVGGAPVTRQFATSIGADMYSCNPQGAVDFLNSVVT